MMTKLTFVNKAAALGQATIILFQKNYAADDSRPDVIWHHIRHCQLGWSHPINFPQMVSVCVSDEFGNFSSKIRCDSANVFEVRPTITGRTIAACGVNSAPEQIIVTNRLPRGAIHINLFRGNRVVARHSALPPLQTAYFRLEPEIWIGATRASLGYDFVAPVRHLDCAKRLSIRNIVSADIEVTMGASNYEPLRFELANINSG